MIHFIPIYLCFTYLCCQRRCTPPPERPSLVAPYQPHPLVPPCVQTVSDLPLLPAEVYPAARTAVIGRAMSAPPPGTAPVFRLTSVASGGVSRCPYGRHWSRHVSPTPWYRPRVQNYLCCQRRCTPPPERPSLVAPCHPHPLVPPLCSELPLLPAEVYPAARTAVIGRAMSAPPPGTAPVFRLFQTYLCCQRMCIPPPVRPSSVAPCQPHPLVLPLCSDDPWRTAFQLDPLAWRCLAFLGPQYVLLSVKHHTQLLKELGK